MNAALLLIAGMTLASAVWAMAARRLLHSVLLLAVTWLGVAFFYLWAGAEFIAFAQVLVYLGAISMAVMFAVLLTRRDREDAARPGSSRRRGGAAIATGAAVAAVLVASVLRTPLADTPASGPAAGVRQLGFELMGLHAASLLVAGVLLTVALIGAVVLATGAQVEKPKDKP